MTRKNIKWSTWTVLAAATVLSFAARPAAAQTQVQLNGFTSTEGPALAVFGSQLFIAWTGQDQKLYSAASSDGLHFGSAVSNTSNTSIPTAAPAIAAFNGKMYLTWTGGSNYINIMSSTDGLNYSNKSLVKNPNNGATETALGTTALTVYNGRLYLAWSGTDSPHFSINVASSSDGVNFTAPFVFLLDGTYGSPYSLGLTQLNGALYVAITGGANVYRDGKTYNLNFVKLSVGAGGSLSVAQTFDNNPALGQSQSGPALAASASELAYAWLQAFYDGTQSRWIEYTQFQTFELQADGSLSANSPVRIASNTGFGSPAVAYFNSHLYYGWLGTDSSRTLNIAQAQ